MLSGSTPWSRAGPPTSLSHFSAGATVGLERLRQRRSQALRRIRAISVPCAYLQGVVSGWGIKPIRIRVIPNACGPLPEVSALWPAPGDDAVSVGDREPPDDVEGDRRVAGGYYAVGGRGAAGGRRRSAATGAGEPGAPTRDSNACTSPVGWHDPLSWVRCGRATCSCTTRVSPRCRTCCLKRGPPGCRSSPRPPAASGSSPICFNGAGARGSGGAAANYPGVLHDPLARAALRSAGQVAVQRYSLEAMTAQTIEILESTSRDP